MQYLAWIAFCNASVAPLWPDQPLWDYDEKKFFGSSCSLPVSKVTDQQISDQEPNLSNGYAKAKCQCPHQMIKKCTRAWEAQMRHVFVCPIEEGGLYIYIFVYIGLFDTSYRADLLSFRRKPDRWRHVADSLNALTHRKVHISTSAGRSRLLCACCICLVPLLMTYEWLWSYGKCKCIFFCCSAVARWGFGLVAQQRASPGFLQIFEPADSKHRNENRSHWSRCVSVARSRSVFELWNDPAYSKSS